MCQNCGQQYCQQQYCQQVYTCSNIQAVGNKALQLGQQPQSDSLPVTIAKENKVNYNFFSPEPFQALSSVALLPLAGYLNGSPTITTTNPDMLLRDLYVYSISFTYMNVSDGNETYARVAIRAETSGMTVTESSPIFAQFFIGNTDNGKNISNTEVVCTEKLVLKKGTTFALTVQGFDVSNPTTPDDGGYVAITILAKQDI